MPNLQAATADISFDTFNDFQHAQPVQGLAPGIEVAVDAVDQRGWEEFATRFADVSYDQTALFSEHQWPGRTSRIQVFEHGQPIGGAVVVQIVPPMFSSGIAYLKFGPMWRLAGENHSARRYETVMRAIINEYTHKRGHQLVVLQRPSPYVGTLESQVLTRLGFAAKREMYDPNRYLVNCTLSEEEQLKSLQQKWRYNLKKSWKNGITVHSGTSEDDIWQFTELHSLMKDRKQFGDHEPIGLVPKLIHEMPEGLKCRIYIANHEQRSVAGAVVAEHGDTAFYLFGASSDQALPLKAGYALQWAILNDLRDGPVKWYDLGGEADSDGLRQFKKGFVGRDGTIIEMAGEYEYKGSLGGSFAANLIFKAREMKRALKEWR